MKKLVLIAATTMLCISGGAYAQLAKAASETASAAEHKIDEKRAETDAKKSGPVGKVVNKTKAGYHKAQAKRSTDKAKQSLKNAVD